MVEFDRYRFMGMIYCMHSLVRIDTINTKHRYGTIYGQCVCLL
jgi:hypothetical protein